MELEGLAETAAVFGELESLRYGRQEDVEATEHLNLMNQQHGDQPWKLTFSNRATDRACHV